MNTDYKCVTTVDGIRDYIGGSCIVAFDFETAPDGPYREEEKAALDPAKAHIVGCSFSVKAGTGIYVPVAHRVGTNKCRNAWWNSHLDQVKRKAVYHIKCLYCGKKFRVYGDKRRKYCSHACYIADRFKAGGGNA